MNTAAPFLHLLERLCYAGFLLDSAGEVLSVNACARRWLSKQGQAAAALPDDGLGWVANTLKRVLRRPSLMHVPDGGAKLVATQSGRPTLCYGLSLGEGGEDGSASILVLVDLDERGRLDPDLLRASFGLTRTEAVVAIQLASGASLRDITKRQGITIGTARRHLSAVLCKTGTCRQAELVALLARLAAVPALAGPAPSADRSGRSARVKQSQGPALERVHRAGLSCEGGPLGRPVPLRALPAFGGSRSSFVMEESAGRSRPAGGRA